MSITEATYSVEDNKLRLYASSRLDAETYERVRAAGFRWAPKQELFVAPAWSPSREDLCLELAGSIEPESTTLVERAEAKAERLDDLATKRGQQANAFQTRADALSERFAYGQPILVGHHSERRARRDQDRMDRAMRQAVDASRAVTYWHYRATGVECHANRKADPGVRYRRIKTLLADLRGLQRAVNHAHRCVGLWQKVAEITDPDQQRRTAIHLANQCFEDWHHTTNHEQRAALEADSADVPALVAALVEGWEAETRNERRGRCVTHLLHRLAYERAELGPVERYAGDITAVILQAFAREHGAAKPVATALDGGLWRVESSVPLPAHLADGAALELDADGWRDLMQAAGYSVPVKKPRKASSKPTVPLVNPTPEDAERLQALWNRRATRSNRVMEISEMPQRAFSARSKGTYSICKTIELDITGRMVLPYGGRPPAEPVCRVRVFTGGGELYSAHSLVVLTDKPRKAVPIEWPVEEASV